MLSNPFVKRQHDGVNKFTNVITNKLNNETFKTLKIS